MLKLQQYRTLFTKLSLPTSSLYSRGLNTAESSAVIECARLQLPKHNKYSYANCEMKGLRLLCDTIGDRVEVCAATTPDLVAYKFFLTQQSFTFREIKQRTDEIAQNLLEMGFNKGDRLALMMPNVPEMCLTLLACAKAGVIGM